uniref:Cation efflux protein cytoplasmic domain-containing protein n=1 Tax=Ascaris lumbricoides TaxID=6252 RepID=A0A9J2PD37_ASCLU
MTEQPFSEGHDNEGLIGEESANGELSDAEVVRDISIADHCHSLLLLQNKDRRAERRLLAVAGLSTLFIVAEFTGGVLAHSLAIMTDAGHMLSDLLSFIISIVAIRIARSPANRRLSFGFHRAEVLGATVSIVIIWILTTVLIMLAIQRIVNNDLDVDSNTMIITASAGVVFNLIMGMVLKCSRHSHSHGIAHSQTTTYITGWRLADPICTFLFSIIVLITSVTVIRDIFFVLMEGTPSHIDYGELQSDLMRVDGVRTVHSLNVWSLNTDKTALAVHLAIDDQSKAIETMKAANRLIRFKHGIHLATVQVEPYESLMASCDFCRPLF